MGHPRAWDILAEEKGHARTEHPKGGCSVQVPCFEQAFTIIPCWRSTQPFEMQVFGRLGSWIDPGKPKSMAIQLITGPNIQKPWFYPDATLGPHMEGL